MSRRLLRQFTIAAAYSGAVIGAGFVSGREVVQFFAVHGGRGLPGAALAGLAFAGFGAAAAYLARAEQCYNYKDLAARAGGPRLGAAFGLLISLTLASALAIMLAGGGALAKQELGWAYGAGVGGTTAAIVLILASDLRGLLWVNSLLVPILLVGQIAVSGATLAEPGALGTHLFRLPAVPSATPWWLMGLLYAGYNLVVGLSILPPAAKRAQSPGEAATAALAGGLALGLCALATTALSLCLWPDVLQVDIPTAYAVGVRWPGRQGLVSTALWLAMIMCGTANAYGLGTRLTDIRRWPANRLAILVVLLCLPVTRLGFSRAIGLLYPVAGAGALTIVIVAALRRFQAGRPAAR